MPSWSMGIPVVGVDFEGESLFVVGAVDHDGSACFDHFGDTVPYAVVDSGADLSDEYAGRDFQSSSGEVAA